jgi:hypothetical protein
LSTVFEIAANAAAAMPVAWLGINLWEDDIPDRTLVVLSGKDLLCDAQVMAEWLDTDTRAKVRQWGRATAETQSSAPSIPDQMLTTNVPTIARAVVPLHATPPRINSAGRNCPGFTGTLGCAIWRLVGRLF